MTPCDLLIPLRTPSKLFKRVAFLFTISRVLGSWFTRSCHLFPRSSGGFWSHAKVPPCRAEFRAYGAFQSWVSQRWWVRQQLACVLTHPWEANHAKRKQLFGCFFWGSNQQQQFRKTTNQQQRQHQYRCQMIAWMNPWLLLIVHLPIFSRQTYIIFIYIFIYIYILFIIYIYIYIYYISM